MRSTERRSKPSFLGCHKPTDVEKVILEIEKVCHPSDYAFTALVRRRNALTEEDEYLKDAKLLKPLPQVVAIKEGKSEQVEKSSRRDG